MADQNILLAATAKGAATYIGTFQRTEAKYILSAQQYAAILELIKSHLEPDAYPHTLVTSLYFDTPDNALIERSLEKPVYKEKLRARVYRSLDGEAGRTAAVEHVFVELKKKYKGTVYKRRIALSVQAAAAFLQGMPYETAVKAYPLHGGADASQQLSAKSCQVAREITAFVQRYADLQPAMYTECERTSWHENGTQLRVTFDAGVCASRVVADPFAFRLPKHSMNLLESGQVLMEIKQVGALPTWLVEALTAYRIFPQSFSKYGTAYQKEMVAKGKLHAACLAGKPAENLAAPTATAQVSQVRHSNRAAQRPIASINGSESKALYA